MKILNLIKSLVIWISVFLIALYYFSNKESKQLNIEKKNNIVISSTIEDSANPIKHQTDCSKTYNSRGDVFYDLDNHDEAIKNYTLAMHCNPQNAKPYCNIAGTLSKSNKYEEALKYYDLALKYQDNYAEAYNGKANALCHLGKYEEAIKLYDIAIKYRSGFSFAYSGKANALSLLGKYEEADKYHDLALKI